MDALITRRSGSSEYNGKFDYSLYDMYGGSILSSLTDINLKDINTSKLRSMNSMFQNCSSLRSLNLSNFNTSKVRSMSYMFYGCSSLQSLDLSNFNTLNLKMVYGMFSNCNALKTLYVRSEPDKKIFTASNAQLPSTCTVIVGKPS